MDDNMEPEYDFSGGRCGQFYKPSVKLKRPVYLDAGMIARLNAIAKKSKASRTQMCDPDLYLKYRPLISL